jgi:hypothetical protein
VNHDGTNTPQNNQHSETGAATFSTRAIFRLSAFVILCALFGVMAFLFKLIPGPRDIMTYRIVVILVCFALSSVSSLLFSTQSKLLASLGGFSIAVAGPATLWLVALLTLAQIFPESAVGYTRSEIFREFTKELAQFSRQKEEQEGWQEYADWKIELGEASSIIDQSEESFIKNMLTRVFYHGRTPTKILAPEVHTVFLYLNDATVKLQSIHGDQPDVDFADVYVTVAPSLPGSQTKSYFFKRTTRGLRAQHVEQGGWRQVRSDEIQCLVVTIYYDDEPKAGDWIYVDLPKYFSDATPGADTKIDILTIHPIREPQVWEMSASQRTQLSPAPLLFRKRARLEEVDTKNPSKLDRRMTNWLRSLKQIRQSESLQEEVHDFLVEFERVLSASSRGLDDWAVFPNIQSHVQYNGSDLKNGVLATFLWSEAAS